MPSIPSFSPNAGNGKFGTLAYPTVTPTTQVLTTGGGVVAGTVAQLLSGLLRMSTTNAQTFTLPTAAAIVAGINGCQVGQSFDVDVINYGASTLTIAVNTGVTTPTIATVAVVLTLATLTAKRFKFVVTNVTPGSEAVEVYGFGSTAAAVA
jgi:hypothetical protein